MLQQAHQVMNDRSRLPNSFFQWLTPGLRWRELAVQREGVARERWAEAPHVIVAAPRAERVLALARGMLKLTARGIYVSPALLLLKPAIAFFDRAVSDYLVVLFVVIVIAFFAALALFILLYGITFFACGRGARFEIKLPTDESDALAMGLLAAAGSRSPISRQPVGAVVRVRGLVEPLMPGPVTEVARDLWLIDDAGARRLSRCGAFAVCPDGGTPVIVQPTSPPWIVGMARGDTADRHRHSWPQPIVDAMDRTGKVARSGITLAVGRGDMVEIHGTVVGHVDNIERIDLDGEMRSLTLPRTTGGASPYRDSGTREGMLVAATDTVPVVIRPIAA